MSRPLRIEFADAVYHVTARGDRREAIFEDDGDRATLLRILGDAMLRFDARILAFCLMGNHYHLVLRTRRANLSQLMRHTNGVYTQAFNRRHTKVGHVFQGRFKAILVDSDAYLLQVCRYVDLNPVRARLIDDPTAWRWSSCRMHLGIDQPPAWLDSTILLAQSLGRNLLTTQDLHAARRRYAESMAGGRDAQLWTQALRQQIYLGDEQFVARMQSQQSPGATDDASDHPLMMPSHPRAGVVPREQTRPPLTLQHWLDAMPTREHALHQAHMVGGLSLTAMARELGLSVSRVSRLVARAERLTQQGHSSQRHHTAKGKT